MKKPIFVTHNSKQGSTAATTTRCGFFVAIFSSSDTDSGVIAFSVNGNQSVLPLFGIVRGKMSMTPLFSLSAYQSGKEYIYKRIKSTNKTMRNTVNGLPAGESNLHDAELRQLFKSYLNNIGGINSLKEGGFQLMESLVASMEVLGLDSDTVLHYFYVCRCTVEFISDLEFILEHSNSSQPCSN